MRQLIAAFCAVMIVAFPVRAEQPSPIRSLLTANDTRGFEAVGRIDFGRDSFCTGTLIAPNLVLTAAHCLFDPETREQIDVSQAEFLAGWRDGRALAYRGVRRGIVHPDYHYQGVEGAIRVVNDLALLELDQPIRNGAVAPLRTSVKPRKGDEVGVVSYAIDRAARPSLQSGCQVLARPEDMLVISCTVDFGASGAPILVFTDGEPRIVSVVSAKAEAMGRAVSLGTDLEAPLGVLMEMARDGGGRLEGGTAMARTSGLNGLNGGSAKFVRP